MWLKSFSKSIIRNVPAARTDSNQGFSSRARVKRKGRAGRFLSEGWGRCWVRIRGCRDTESGIGIFKPAAGRPKFDVFWQVVTWNNRDENIAIHSRICGDSSIHYQKNAITNKRKQIKMCNYVTYLYNTHCQFRLGFQTWGMNYLCSKIRTYELKLTFIYISGLFCFRNLYCASEKKMTFGKSEKVDPWHQGPFHSWPSWPSAPILGQVGQWTII